MVDRNFKCCSSNTHRNAVEQPAEKTEGCTQVYAVNSNSFIAVPALQCKFLPKETNTGHPDKDAFSSVRYCLHESTQIAAKQI